jgi:hypothetical protein
MRQAWFRPEFRFYRGIASVGRLGSLRLGINPWLGGEHIVEYKTDASNGSSKARP